MEARPRFVQVAIPHWEASLLENTKLLTMQRRLATSLAGTTLIAVHTRARRRYNLEPAGLRKPNMTIGDTGGSRKARHSVGFEGKWLAELTRGERSTLIA